MEVRRDKMEINFNATNIVEEIVMQVKENEEEFIFETILPYCENILQIKINKEELKQILLNSMQKTPFKWIPVSERLPEKYKEVIVTDIETVDTYESYYIGDGYWECDNGAFKNRIIAWMPKPEPYKGESEGDNDE